MAVKMTVKVRKRKSNNMRLPTAVRIAEITSKGFNFSKFPGGACPQTPLGARRLRHHAMWAEGPHKIWTPTFKILAKSLIVSFSLSSLYVKIIIIKIMIMIIIIIIIIISIVIII